MSLSTVTNDNANNTKANNSQLNAKDTLAILKILKSRVSEWRTFSLEHVLQHHVVDAFDYSLEVIAKRIEELWNEYHIRRHKNESQWRWYRVLQELDEALTMDETAEQEKNGREAKRRKTERFLEEEVEAFMDYWREATSTTIDPTTKRITGRYLEEKEKQDSSDYESTWVWFNVIDKFIQKHNINLSDFEERREIVNDEDWLHQNTETVMTRGPAYMERWIEVASKFLRAEAYKTQRDGYQVRKAIEEKQRLFAEKIARNSGLI